MEHSDFAIGRAFATGHSLWRCTDVGTRTVVAIRLDSAETVSVEVRGGRCGPETRKVIDPRRDPGWLSGPPYAVAETVFDEYDFPACMLVTDEDVAGWTPERERDRRR
jgi:hypothetical protein